MENQLEIQKKQLPKLEDLYNNSDLISKQSELNILLNKNPKQDWIKINPFANNTAYLPIERVEYLLTAIYSKWRLEIKEYKVIANAVVVTVRLHVQDPITGEWDWQDGIGASPIQTKSGASATDFTQVNTAAVQMAAPAAETYALKDAAEKFGKIFGKDLNRKDEINYSNMLESKIIPKETPIEPTEIPSELLLVISEASLESLPMIYSSNKEYHTNPLFMQLLTNRKTELNGATTEQN